MCDYLYPLSGYWLWKGRVVLFVFSVWHFRLPSGHGLWGQTIDKVGQLLGHCLVSKDNWLMKCTTSNLLTCRVTNGGFMLFRSQKIKQHISVGVLIVYYFFCRHYRNVTSDVCHGSTISSANCLWKLNHAQKVGQLYRSADVGFRVVT